MKLKNYIFLGFIFLILVMMGLNSCVREKNFPPQPSIEFMTYLKYGIDSADCFISFKDGDGDIGIYKGDTISPDNLTFKYLYKGTDGEFHPFDLIDTTAAMDTLFYSYRVPNITPDGQYKALDGEIKAKLRVAPIYVPGHTTVKFEITLYDRAGNRSNTVSTNEISLP